MKNIATENKKKHSFTVGDNHSKIETAMAKIEREGNHPDELEKVGQRFQVARACAGRDIAH